MQRILTSLDVDLPPIPATQQLVHEDEDPEPPRGKGVALSERTKVFRNESIPPELPLEASSTQIDSSVEAASAAAACISSNKHKRPAHTSSKNEDRVYVHRTDSGEALFVAVFDGHGGNAQCSQFLSEQLHEIYEAELAVTLREALERDEGATSVTPDVVLRSLERAFVRTDEEFYKLVQEKARLAGLRGAKTRMCRCNFYYEDPCVCMGPPISANEGSTATVVVVSKEHFVVANVGDSDAYVVRKKETENPMSESDAFLFQDKPTFARARPSDEDRSRSLKRVKSSRDEGDEEEEPPQESNSAAAHSFALEQLTECDNPSRQHVDYTRIAAVAKSRFERPLPYGFARPISSRASLCGLLENPNNVRFNYVCIPGARSLNMARAFGNLGAKTFTEQGKFVEAESGIIARPHMRVVERTSDMHALILGSDGLWDNLSTEEISDTLCRVLPRDAALFDVRTYHAHTQELDATVSDDALIFGEPGVNKTNSKSLHHAAAKNLLTRALGTMRKPDDISVVVVALSASDGL